MRYVVVGAGAVGGIIGAQLAEAGTDVVLVARGTHLATMREHGLTVITASGHRTVPVTVAAGPDEVALTTDDVLVLATKSQDTVEVLTQWRDQPVIGAAGHAGELIPVVCAQNGVTNEAAAASLFSQVIGMSVWLPATFVSPGTVSAAGVPVVGVLTVGAAVPGVPAAVPEQIAADLTAAGFRSEAVADVMAWKHDKLLTNIPNAVEALCGPITSPAARALAADAIAEGRAILAAEGQQLPSPDRVTASRGDFRLVQLEGHLQVGSTWQSLQRGSGVEVEWLNGEIVRRGAAIGVATPLNTALLTLTTQAAADGSGPGASTPEQVRRAAAELAEAARIAAAVRAAVEADAATVARAGHAARTAGPEGSGGPTARGGAGPARSGAANGTGTSPTHRGSAALVPARTSVRVDAWTWAVRLYPTRSAAAAACRGGHVKVNDERAKPATTVRPGDVVVAWAGGRQRIVEVVQPLAKRVGAPAAAEAMIDTSPAPQDAPPRIAVRDRGAGRPTKRDRRQIDRLRDGARHGELTEEGPDAEGEELEELEES